MACTPALTQKRGGTVVIGFYNVGQQSVVLAKQLNISDRQPNFIFIILKDPALHCDIRLLQHTHIQLPWSSEMNLTRICVGLGLWIGSLKGYSIARPVAQGHQRMSGGATGPVKSKTPPTYCKASPPTLNQSPHPTQPRPLPQNPNLHPTSEFRAHSSRLWDPGMFLCVHVNTDSAIRPLSFG